MFRDSRRHWSVTGLLIVGALGALVTAQGSRQREGRGGPATGVPVHRVARTRDGVSVFPKVDYAQLKPLRAGEIDFAHYHSFEETVSLLRTWASTYPGLVDTT